MPTSTVIISQKRKGGQDLLEETGVKKYRYKYRFVVKKQLWSLKTLTNTPLFHLLLLLVFFVLIIMKRSLCLPPAPSICPAMGSSLRRTGFTRKLPVAQPQWPGHGSDCPGLYHSTAPPTQVTGPASWDGDPKVLFWAREESQHLTSNPELRPDVLISVS